MYSLGIINGEIYIDGSFVKKNLYVENEKIAAMTNTLEDCNRTIDASGLKVLPGFIDPHVHFALGVGANVSKDDFIDGSREAALGGVTTFIDFLDPVKKAEEIDFEFEKRNRMAKGSIVDWAFHTTIANPSSEPEEIYEESLKKGINSVKLFTTYADTDRRTYEEYIYKLLEASKDCGCRVLVHAEKDELIDKSKGILVKNHSDARPVACEAEEVMELAAMAKETDGNLYIVHTNCGSTVREIEHKYGAQLAKGNIILESCPHYFLLNADKLSRQDGYKYTMTPPLRPEKERQLLADSINSITTIGTDHCPYIKEQKNHPYTSQIPMGIGGIRYSFLAMYGMYGFHIVDKFTSGPASVYGLESKGALREGMDADVVLFNEKSSTQVNDEMSVYDGITFKGAIEMVVARGALVNDHGKLIEHEGKYIPRKEIGGVSDERYQ